MPGGSLSRSFAFVGILHEQISALVILKKEFLQAIFLATTVNNFYNYEFYRPTVFKILRHRVHMFYRFENASASCERSLILEFCKDASLVLACSVCRKTIKRTFFYRVSQKILPRFPEDCNKTAKDSH